MGLITCSEDITPRVASHVYYCTVQYLPLVALIVPSYWVVIGSEVSFTAAARHRRERRGGIRKQQQTTIITTNSPPISESALTPALAHTSSMGAKRREVNPGHCCMYVSGKGRHGLARCHVGPGILGIPLAFASGPRPPRPVSRPRSWFIHSGKILGSHMQIGISRTGFVLT